MNDAIVIVLFHCCIKCFISLLQEGAYGTGYIEQKVQLLCVL